LIEEYYRRLLEGGNSGQTGGGQRAFVAPGS
jgi:hypothetical protein